MGALVYGFQRWHWDCPTVDAIRYRLSPRAVLLLLLLLLLPLLLSVRLSVLSRCLVLLYGGQDGVEPHVLGVCLGDALLSHLLILLHCGEGCQQEKLRWKMLRDQV